MGIKDDIGAGIQEIFQEFADILTPVTYREFVSEVYTPGGSITQTTANHSIECIITDFTMMEKQMNTVLNDDMKLIISGLDLAFTPDTKGVIVFQDSTEGTKVDPTNQLYILQVRK